MKVVNPQQAKRKIEQYCAYQERSHKEVRDKLYSYGLYRSDVDDIITQLITDGFLSEERFAKAFAGGKFRMKRWGRVKITHALEGKGVSTNCIKIGLREIDEADYEATLREIIHSRIASLSDEDNAFTVRDKLARYAIQKGFEADLVWKEVFLALPKK